MRGSGRRLLQRLLLERLHGADVDAGRAELRAVEDCPKPLQPLAELQYRGVIFSHPNGRDWTPSAFLANHLGVEVAGDGAPRRSLARALPYLAERPVSELAAQAPLHAADLDAAAGR